MSRPTFCQYCELVTDGPVRLWANGDHITFCCLDHADRWYNQQTRQYRDRIYLGSAGGSPGD
jgi:hypothetical protein